jgi:hypothetical protein
MSGEGLVMPKLLILSLIVWALAGGASTAKYSASMSQVHTLSTLRPMVLLETFPEGRTLQTPEARHQTQRELEKELQIQLHQALRIEVAPELAPEIPEVIQKQLKSLWVVLHTASEIKSVELTPELKTFMQAQPGEGELVLMYYSGFQRSKGSMTEGYQNSAFQTDLVPRAYAREVDGGETKHLPQELAQGRYVAVPEKFGATLKLVIIQKATLKPIYYDSLHFAEDPLAFSTLQTLVRKIAQEVKRVAQ